MRASVLSTVGASEEDDTGDRDLITGIFTDRLSHNEKDSRDRDIKLVGMFSCT